MFLTIIFTVIFVLLFTLLFYSLFKYLRDSIKNTVVEFCYNFFWNGAIHSLQVTFMDYCFAVSNQMVLLVKGSEALGTGTIWTSIVMGVGLIAILVFIFVFTYVKKRRFWLI